MADLSHKKCKPCEGGVTPLPNDKIQQMMQKIPGWQVGDDGKHIVRKFQFKGFYKTMSLLNAVAYIAQTEGHHPDMEVGYNYLNVKITTHAIDGLSENDFILASKINALL